MRGDSRRDLYAKTLALLGLGVLAGTGAVVDYWPVGVRHPQGLSAFARVALDVPTPLDVPAVPVAPVASATSATVSTSGDQVATRASRREPDPGAMTYASLPTTVGALSVGATVALQPLPPPVLIVARDDMSSLRSNAALQLTAPPPTTRADRMTAYAAPADRDGDGFFAGAFKRTGTSIVRTGAKTGTSLVDAVRVVGSVVRRALPNKD